MILLIAALVASAFMITTGVRFVSRREYMPGIAVMFCGVLLIVCAIVLVLRTFGS